MNNDLEQFSEERLKEIVSAIKLEPCDYHDVYDNIPHGEIAALARIALSVKQDKPVRFMAEWSSQYGGMECDYSEVRSEMEDVAAEHDGSVIDFYTTPQPAHTEHVIPSEIPKVPHNGVMAYKKDGSIYSTNYARGWNDCVQATLAAAPKPESE